MDSDNPGRVWERDASKPFDEGTDYAIVARFRETSTANTIVVLAGLQRFGTDAASQFVLNPSLLEELNSRVGSNWRHKNIEVVLRVDVVGGRAGAPHDGFLNQLRIRTASPRMFRQTMGSPGGEFRQRVQVWQLHHPVFREKGGDLLTVGDNGKKVEQTFCGVSHGSLSSKLHGRNVTHLHFDEMGQGVSADEPNMPARQPRANL